MAMIKWDPLRELQNMQEEMNRLFELSRSRMFGEPLEEGLWRPQVDIYEDEGQVVVKMEAPEVDLKDITVTVEENRLCIEGVRHLEGKNEQTAYLRLERSYGPFRRLFDLPAAIDRDGIATSCDRGVLRIVLPKKELSRRKIEGKEE